MLCSTQRQLGVELAAGADVVGLLAEQLRLRPALLHERSSKEGFYADLEPDKYSKRITMVVNKDGYLADYMDDTGRRAARTGKIESWMPGDRTLTMAVKKTPPSMDYPAVLPTLSVNEELLNAWPAMEMEQETPSTGGASSSGHAQKTGFGP